MINVENFNDVLYWHINCVNIVRLERVIDDLNVNISIVGRITTLVVFELSAFPKNTS